MTGDRRKDRPGTPSPAAAPAAPPEAELLTSEDIFGEILDSFEGDRPAAAAGEPAPPRRTEPIRVRVSEPGVAKKASKQPAPLAGEILSEDVAALLDAFSGPAEAATRAEAVSPEQPLPSAVPEQKPVKPSLPVAATPARADARPAAEDPDRLLRRALRSPASPASTKQAPPAPPATKPRPSAAAKAPPVDEAFQDLLNLRRPKQRRPMGRAAAKVKEAPPEVPREKALDLASVAEEAFRQAAPVPVAKAKDVAPSGPAAGVPAGEYGPYGLLERIAVGGMAEVFKAKRSGVEGFEKVVAVKRILPHLSDNKEFVDMFINEAKMVAGLTHPNIVQIFDLGKIEKSYYIAMEYVHGRDLRSILRRAKEGGLRIPLDLSVLIVSKVSSALEFAHRKKDERGRPIMIVHRDVSPQNILISFEGEVKLTDFGIAKAAAKATMTEAGALRGKLLYMSPEQAWGKPMDRRSDLFSLGLVFYEMVTEERPFLAHSEMSILEMVRECRVAPPSTLNPRIPEKLEKAIMKALERDPNHRYQDAAEMCRDLERVLHERQPPTTAELARFMEILFDEDERADALPGEGTAPEFRPHTAGPVLDVEFDEAPPAEPPATTPEAEPGGPKEAMSIQKLLKRFGIK